MLKKLNLAALLLPLAIVSPALGAKTRSDAEAQKVADRVLGRAIIIDTHADTPQMMLDENYDPNNSSEPKHQGIEPLFLKIKVCESVFIFNVEYTIKIIRYWRHVI